jgi:transposase-like protein
MHLTNVADCA